MSMWLHARIKGDPNPKHEFFHTEELARDALTPHKQRGDTITENRVGGNLRHEVSDKEGFVAVYWLSSHSDDS